MGIIGNVVWKIDKELIGLIMVGVVVVFIVFGGFMGVVIIDMVLFFCMVFGLIMVMLG